MELLDFLRGEGMLGPLCAFDSRMSQLELYLLVIALGKGLVSRSDWLKESRHGKVRWYEAAVRQANKIHLTAEFKQKHTRCHQFFRLLVDKSKGQWQLLGQAGPKTAMISNQSSLCLFLRQVRRVQVGTGGAQPPVGRLQGKVQA